MKLTLTLLVAGLGAVAFSSSIPAQSEKRSKTGKHLTTFSRFGFD